MLDSKHLHEGLSKLIEKVHITIPVKLMEHGLTCDPF